MLSALDPVSSLDELVSERIHRFIDLNKVDLLRLQNKMAVDS